MAKNFLGEHRETSGSVLVSSQDLWLGMGTASDLAGEAGFGNLHRIDDRQQLPFSA
jgi:hypothetical protein